MSLLFRVLYAAHANGTHHKLALDALNHMERGDAEAWRRVFLKHAKLYLEGSKAPDVSFKDFKNHVLHIGGLVLGRRPGESRGVVRHTVAALREQRWADAVYAAGVLSHYYTDPIHPFHTGQTEAENSIHRAVEWTINRSYNALRTIGEARFGTIDRCFSRGPALAETNDLRRRRILAPLLRETHRAIITSSAAWSDRRKASTMSGAW